MGLLAPIIVSLSPFISSSYPSFLRPMTASAMNIAIYTMSMKVVKDRHLKTGQHISISMSR